MVQILTELSEDANKKIRMFMVINNLANKADAINKYIEATEFVEEDDGI